MKTISRLLSLFCASVFAISAWATPTVTITQVQQNYPWTDGVQIKYTVTDGVTDGSYTAKFVATVNDTATDVTAALEVVSGGDALLSTGEHVLKWTPAANLKDTAAGLAIQVIAEGDTTIATVSELKVYCDATFATKSEVAATYLTTAAAATTYQPVGSYQAAGSYLTTTDAADTYLTKTDASATYQAKGTYLTAHQDISGKADKATTLAGYGITDAKIANGAITLGANTITPLTAHQDISGKADASDLAALSSTVAAGATASISASAGAPYMIVDLATGAVSYAKGGNWNTDLYKTAKMVFRYVPAGSYVAMSNRTTKATATMAKGYYIGIFPVTEAQYALMNNASASTTPTADNMRPQASVSYGLLRYNNASIAEASARPASFGADIVAASPIGKLNSRTGLVFDFPTEAMWQVACRAAGSSTYNGTNDWFFGSNQMDLSKYAWWAENNALCDDGYGHVSGRRVVGTKLPNQWGLYDMIGNVWEWCLDGSVDADNSGVEGLTQTPDFTNTARRRVRGGACNLDATRCSSWYRGRLTVGDTGDSLGFRLSRIVQ